MKLHSSHTRMVLGGLIIAGLCLRLYNLGNVGFVLNEDYTAISVARILDEGIPIFPSGILYPRALPFSYLTAGFAKLIGSSEFSLRLPSVLFSTASILVLFLLGKQLFGVPVGLLAALLLSVSDWEVGMAQTARMYGTTTFFILLSFYLCYRSTFERKKYLYTTTLLSIILTGTLHKLSLVLVPMYGCLALYLFLRKSGFRFVLLCAVVASVVFLLNSKFEKKYTRQWALLVEEKVSLEVTDTKLNTGRKRVKKKLTERVMPIFHQLKTDHPFVIKCVMLVWGVMIICCAAAFVRFRQLRLWITALGILSTCLLVQQTGLAVVVLVTYIFVGYGLKTEKYWQRSLLLILFVILGSACWALPGLSVESVESVNGIFSKLKNLVKLLFAYPPNFGLIFFDKYPFMTFLVLIGGAFAAKDYFYDRKISSLGVAILILAVPIFIIGLHPMSLRRMFERYVSILNPFFILIVSSVIVRMGKELQTFIKRRCDDRRIIKFLLPVYFILIAIPTVGYSMQRSVARINIKYGENQQLPIPMKNRNYFHPDHKGSSEYVRDHYADPDVVIPMDILAHYTYFPKADYQLTVFKKRDAEGWIGVERIKSPTQLLSMIKAQGKNRIWFILSGEMILWSETWPEMLEMLELIPSLCGPPRYEGRDGLSHVYLYSR